MKLKPLSIFSMRAAMTLAFTVLTFMTVGAEESATQFITEVKLIGHKEEAKFNQLQSDLEATGWKAINKDLNAGCGSSSDYIHLLYKAEENTDGLNHGYITDFYITASTSSDYDEQVTYNGRTYKLVLCDGSKEFMNSKGDLNRGAAGNYIHLYYTTDPLDEEIAVTGISFNNNKKDGVNDKKGTDGIDLNKGCGSGTDYIYMHITTEKATTLDWGIGKGADGSKEHPYVITTTTGLDQLAKSINSGTDYEGTYFNLGADIEYAHETDWDDATSTENNYTAIGGYHGDTNEYYFRGHFNGCGHTVKGIRIYKGGRDFTNGYQGLFGRIDKGGSVSHLTLDDARITGYGDVAGIVGANWYGTVTDCHVTTTVCIHAVQTDANSHGGIVGWNNYPGGGAIVSGCTSRAVITVTDGVENCTDYGGIVGHNEEEGTIKDCLYLGGEIGGNKYVSAIAGWNKRGTIENCYYTDASFTGKDGEGKDVTADGIKKAIAYSYNPISENNVGLARTITLGESVVLSGHTNKYGLDGAAISLTAYAPAEDANGFALKLETTGKESTTTYYSTTDAIVGIKYDGELPTGTIPAFTIMKSDNTPVTVTNTNGIYTFTMPADDVTVTAGALDLWGIGNGADGSEENPYVITTTAGLDLLAKMVNSGTEYEGKFFVLDADIEYAHETDWNDAKSTENNYTAIGYRDGTKIYYFKGHLDGCGHTVKGIRIYKGSTGLADCFQGLFCQIGEGGSVSHVTLDDARITGDDMVGGIAGYNYGTITDCHVTATVCIHAVKDEACGHGGIVGVNDNSSGGAIVSGCTSKASITVAEGVGNCREYGGIVGFNTRGIIKDCLYLGGQVGGTRKVGAIAGWNHYGTIENCYYADRGFTGKDEEGNAVMLSGGNPAIGSHYEDCTEKNVGLARTITLGEGVVLGGTATNYAEDIKNPAQHLTTYANGASVFALELTTNSSGTTGYSPTGATVGIKYDGELPTGAVPAFTVAHANGDVFIVSKDGDNYTFIMPADNVTVAAGDLWGIGNGADGSEENPYVITTTAGLDLLAKMVNSGTEYEGKFFVLDADIEYAHETDWNDAKSTESNYTAIGGFIDNYWRYFEGHFDGCGHTVKGIRIYKGGTDNFENYQGLFGQIGEGGSVSHLTLDDTRITGFDFTGGIAGFIKHGTITDCHVTTTVCIHAVQTDAYYHGGIVGHNNKSNSGTVSGCTSRAVITIADGIRNCLGYGGIIGHDQSSIKDCLYLGSEVGGNRYVGAIVGWNEGGTIENCYYTDANFKGKKTNGDDITLDNGNPAIGYHDDGYTEKKVGLARTITLGEGVVLSGTATNYAKGVKNPTTAVTGYAPAENGNGFALKLETTGKDAITTTYYSTAGATVGVKYDGELPTSAIQTFTVSKSDKTTVTVTDTDGTYTFEMPADNVTVTIKVKLPGDVNDDLKVDAADVMAVLKIMLENGYDQKADVNNDNKVDIADIITIVNIMSGS